MFSAKFPGLIGLPSLFLCLLISPEIPAHAQDLQRGNQLLSDYFRIKTAEIADRCLAEIQTAQDWNTKKAEYRSQLQQMLGLSPWPERTPLNAVVTGRIEKEDFVVEKLHFEASPGLYVGANLYRPKVVQQPLPAILYVCGHSSQKQGNVSFGNKTGYQHHGIWFARNGYVCLIIDTIQLGEFSGIHHGTHAASSWWWHSRGYTPAGAEAWNGIRALDYLQSRAEVDPERIGMTGRSGGGAYTWFVSALDERVKVAVPVAGITDMRDHVVNGCVKGHCDCMYQVNTFGWDFPQLAALIAPRPLLISNTDKDLIFPLNGVVNIYNKTRRIYELLGATKHIGLCIAEGGHQDVQQLQNDAFMWFNRFLKNDNSQISMTTEKLFEPAELKVFTSLPQDERVTTVQEWLVPAHRVLPHSKTRAEFQQGLIPARALLLAQSSPPHSLEHAQLQPVHTLTSKSTGMRLREFQFDADDPYRLSFYMLDHEAQHDDSPLQLEILNQARWELRMSQLKSVFPQLEIPGISQGTDAPPAEWAGRWAFFAPRGIGPTRWTEDPKQQIHIRRRFPLLGTTLERVQVEDVRQALRAIGSVPGESQQTIELTGYDEAASWALYATFLQSAESPAVSKLSLVDLPTPRQERAQFLGLEQAADLQDILAGVADTISQLTLICHREEDRKFCQQAAQDATQIDIPKILIQEAVSSR